MEITGQIPSARKRSEDKRRDLVVKFDQFVDLFSREISRYNIVPADSEIIHFLLNTVSDILEDGFVNPELGESEEEEYTHYWPKYTEVIHSETIKFVNSLDQFTSDSEKAYVWILIELHNRNLARVFEEISSTPAIINCYFPRCLIKKHYQEVHQTLKKLSMIEYKIESKFLQAYEEYENGDYDQYHENELDVQNHMAVQSPKAHRSFELIPPKAEASEEFPPHNMSMDSPTIFPIASGSLENTRTSSLFKSGSSLKGRLELNKKDSIDTNKHPLDLRRFDEIDEGPSMTSIEELKGESQDIQPEEEGTSTITPRWRHRRQASKLQKSSSFQHLNLQTDILQAEPNIISPIEYPNHSPKSESGVIKMTSPLDHSPNLEKPGYQIPESPTGSEGDLFPAHPETANKKKLVISGFSGIKSDIHNSYDTPIFRNDRNDGKEYGHSAFTYNNIPNTTVKNSEQLYTEVFQRMYLQFQYRERPIRQIKVEEQKDKCFNCDKSLSKRFLFFWPKMGYCHYTGQWYCTDCMAQEGSMIPWYIVEKWDFRSYSVCKKAQRELLQLFDKPNIILEYNNSVIQTNKLLYDTLVRVTRRQLHLMFDMICDPDLMLTRLDENKNLLLKQNLFSLKNLEEISRGTLLIYLEKCYITMTKHVAICPACQGKGKFCEICMEEPKVYPYDIKNTAVCPSCKRLYHSKCYVSKKCQLCK